MKDVSIITEGKLTEVSFQNLTIWFSYKTPIAFMTPETGRVVRENSWGVTTGRHLNAINNDKGKRIAGSDFDRQLSTILQAMGLNN